MLAALRELGELYVGDDGFVVRSGMHKLAYRKEQSMKTFEELKALLTQDLLELEQLPRFGPKRPLFDVSPRRPRCDCGQAVGESRSTHREPWGVGAATGHAVLPCPSV
jgi:hypothetical protein